MGPSDPGRRRWGDGRLKSVQELRKKLFMKRKQPTQSPKKAEGKKEANTPQASNPRKARKEPTQNGDYQEVASRKEDCQKPRGRI
jgi:hypothetical protein